MNSLTTSFEGAQIAVIGDVMLDRYIWGQATRISPEAPVPVVRVERETWAAGAAANVALNLKALGADVTLCGWTGRDQHGKRLRELLLHNGIETAPMHDDAHTTIVKTRVMAGRQQLCRLDNEAPPSEYAMSEQALETHVRPLIKRVDAVILSDYAKGALTNQTISWIRQTAGANVIVALDPKPRPGLAFTDMDLMTPNRQESLLLAEIEHPFGSAFPAEEVCRKIWERFAPRHLVVTLGADGMLLSEQGRILECMPTVARDVFDVSGAGDTVISALTAALATGSSLHNASHYANAAAGVVVGKTGTATATPEEIDAFLAAEEERSGS